MTMAALDNSQDGESAERPCSRQGRGSEELFRRSCVFWKGCTNLAQTSWPNIRYAKHVALGQTHVAILTHEKVFCFGSNEFGQLGNGTFTSAIEPAEVTSLTGLGPDCVAVGQSHTVCSTRDGAVYCWGDSSKGQCGTGELGQYPAPTLVQEFNVLMRRVACCNMATVCLTTGGTVFVWGSGSVLGRPRLAMLCKPMQLTFLDARCVIDVACGSDFCVAISEKLSPVVRKFVQKNNYVIVHCVGGGSSSSALKDGGSSSSSCGGGGRGVAAETALLATEHKHSAANVCPLGLELAEEHVYLAGSDGSPFGSLRKSDLQVGYVKGQAAQCDSPPSATKELAGVAPDDAKESTSALGLAGLPVRSGEGTTDQDETQQTMAEREEASETRPLLSRTSLNGTAIVADQDAAMAYLKKQLGEVALPAGATTRDTKNTPAHGNRSTDNADSGKSNAPLFTRFVSAGTSSAAAVVGSVSSLIQDSLVPSLTKLPIIDRLNFITAHEAPAVAASFSVETPPSAGSNTPNDMLSTSDGYDNVCAGDTARASGNRSSSTKRFISSIPSSPERQSLTRIPDFLELRRDLRVTLNTDVCSWGKGDCGQLGHGDTLDRSQPCFINRLNDENVVSISAGTRHVLALTADGRVFGWGDNMHDQLGLRKKQCILEPQLLEVVQMPVFKIAAGDRHSMLLHDHPRDAKPCLFYTGRDGGSSGATVGARLPFVDKLGLVTDVFAGDMCDCCAIVNTSPSGLDLCYEELKISERDFYKRITEIANTIIKTIVDSDIFSFLDTSLYARAWRGIIEALYNLADAVGVNVQLLGRCNGGTVMAAVASSQLFSDTYLMHFEKYSSCYHNFLALDGVPFLVGAASVVLRSVQEKLDGLMDSCHLEGNGNDLQTYVALLLQFPLRRVSEYRLLLEKMSLTLDNSETLSGALSALSNLENCLTADYNAAQITQIFWDKCPEKLAIALKASGRRVVLDSKTATLQLHGAAKLSNHWFILFNDVFVHVQNLVMHRTFPLLTVWVEQLPEDDPVRLGLRLIMPEDVIVLQATSAAERVEWLSRLHETICQCCRQQQESRATAAGAGGGAGARKQVQRPATGRRRAAASRPLTLSPAARQAKHLYVKPGRVCGAVYSGAWRNGRASGEGEITYADGSVYRGKFRDGEHCGYGVYRQRLASGEEEVLEGEWKAGKLDGYGSVRYSNGDTYEGLFREGVKHGHGVLKTGSSRTPGLWSVYVGEWLNDKRHGYGVLDDASRGEKYLGQWQNDLRTGCGVLVALDGSYSEGTFVNGKLLGNGLMLTSDGTCYEGQFAGGAEINGRGRLTFPSGDHIEGQFTGSWLAGIRVAGLYHKPFVSDVDASVHHSHFLGSPLPRMFGKYSVPAAKKWEELFRHAHAMLGCVDDKPVSVDKAWENVAIRVVANRQRLIPDRKEPHMEDLEKIPSHSRGSLTLKHYREVQQYLKKACDSCCHPLGQLVRSLVDVYRATYLGAGAQPHLLHHAREEAKSLMQRLYSVIRLLFPDLPENGGPCLILPEKPKEQGSQVPSVAVSPTHYDSSVRMEDGEVTSWSLLLHPILLPKVYPPLFSLYALQNEADDEKYWHRVERFNKQSDVALMAYLGVDERFWLLNSCLADGPEERLSLAKDKYYIVPIEVLQQLTTAFTPADKLLIIQQTFTEINKLVKQHLGQRFVWTMDDLFPVFQFVVIRARLRHLGAEIHFISDLMDKHLEHGELGLMFTTIKACHFQIQTEKLV